MASTQVKMMETYGNLSELEKEINNFLSEQNVSAQNISVSVTNIDDEGQTKILRTACISYLPDTMSIV
ncbi:hypothetical protein ACWOAH_02840 [Vagococcus vulneris]|uniref:Uncharacterized protein n=1 Tax=Vagococcus vulneris TaxID=1977869 RepID=A0A430A0S9_9ENTE|nr:hypothetical protein [Vagococcus vulneris]RSU00015.1 hypothetical protein CBF37_01540 [Vagococcus vulneris]